MLTKLRQKELAKQGPNLGATVGQVLQLLGNFGALCDHQRHLCGTRGEQLFGNIWVTLFSQPKFDNLRANASWWRRGVRGQHNCAYACFEQLKLRFRNGGLKPWT